MTFPLILSSGLRGLDEFWVFGDNLVSNKTGHKFLGMYIRREHLTFCYDLMFELYLILAFFGVFLGIIMSQLVSKKMQGKYWSVHVTIHLMENFHNAMLWVLPTFLLSVFLTSFKRSCKDASFDSYEKILSSYQNIASATANFSLLYFICIQSFTIFNTFTYVATMFKKEMNLSQVIFYGGSFIHIFSLLFNLLILTSSMDDAFQDLQYLKRNIIEKLRLSSLDEDQRLELSYIKDRIEMMRPMSASGYFDIDKTTLTSMLSVRY